MDQFTWQEETISQLQVEFKRNEDVIAFAVFGSTARLDNKPDFWSDIDGLLVVKDIAFGKFSNDLTGIKFIGEIYSYQHQPGEDSQTYRLVFNDFRKLDLIIIKQPAIDAILYPYSSPYWKDIKVLFSKSTEIKRKLEDAKKEITIAHFSEQQFRDLVNNFWFVASLALYKTVRNDLLISQHLTLDLYKDCLLLGMILRDRETGTNIHKTGGMGNDLAQDLNLSLGKITQGSIINLIDDCGKSFDQLCIKWNPKFLPKHPILNEFIQKAKSELEN